MAEVAAVYAVAKTPIMGIKIIFPMILISNASRIKNAISIVFSSSSSILCVRKDNCQKNPEISKGITNGLNFNEISGITHCNNLNNSSLKIWVSKTIKTKTPNNVSKPIFSRFTTCLYLA